MLSGRDHPGGAPRRAGAPLGAVALALAVLVATPVPAQAGHVCSEEVITRPNGTVKIVRVCEPHGDDGGGDGGGGDASDVTCEQTYWPAGTEPAPDAPVNGGPYVWWRDIEEREDGGTWGEGYFHCTNNDTAEEYDASWWTCYANCDGGAVVDPRETIDGLLQQALDRVRPPLPGARHTFDVPADDGTVRAVVNAETWWWAEADHGPIVESDSDGPVWVRVTANPGPMTVDPGDGSPSLDCAGVGLPYNHEQSYYDQVPGEPRGACVHVYRSVADAVTATMTVTWAVTYEGFAPGLGNVSGTLPTQVRQESVTFPVKEIQSVIVR